MADVASTIQSSAYSSDCPRQAMVYDWANSLLYVFFAYANKVNYCTSDNSGVSWSARVELTTSIPDTEFSYHNITACIDTEGELWVAYAVDDPIGHHKRIRAVYTSGGIWQAEITLVDPAGSSSTLEPLLISDPTSIDITLVYRTKPTWGGGCEGVFLKHRDDGWNETHHCEAPLPLSYELRPAACYTNNGDVHIAFNAKESGVYNLYYVSGSWATSFSSPSSLGTTYFDPCVFSNGATVWIVCQGPAQIEIVRVYGSNVPDSCLAGGGVSSRYHSVCGSIDGAGIVWVAWVYTDGGGNSSLYTEYWNGVDWTIEENGSALNTCGDNDLIVFHATGPGITQRPSVGYALHYGQLYFRSHDCSFHVITIAATSPNWERAGVTRDVLILGTNFTGAASVSFGAGITVNNFTVVTSTLITVNITIATDATVGARTVVIDSGSLTDGFTIGDYSIPSEGLPLHICQFTHGRFPVFAEFYPGEYSNYPGTQSLDKLTSKQGIKFAPRYVERDHLRNKKKG